ncbi:MAG: response regulator, partial [Gammaproteobacteria bacterium]
ELSRASLPLHIEFAETGEQALAKTSTNHYDFLFLDVMMPGMDGYETCSQIRNTGGYKKTPIIMLSAKTSPMDEVKGIMSGCTNYVTKPIDADEFQHMLDRIMHWIGNYRKHQ